MDKIKSPLIHRSAGIFYIFSINQAVKKCKNFVFCHRLTILGFAPNFFADFADEVEFCPLLGFGEDIALFGGGETALRA